MYFCLNIAILGVCHSECIIAKVLDLNI